MHLANITLTFAHHFEKALGLFDRLLFRPHLDNRITGDQLLRFREVTENLPQICSDKERLFNEIVLATTDEVNQVVRLVTSTRPTPGT